MSLLTKKNKQSFGLSNIGMTTDNTLESVASKEAEEFDLFRGMRKEKKIEKKKKENYGK